MIFLVCLLEVTDVGAPQRVEWMLFDWRVRLAHDHFNHASDNATNLGIAEISDNTIAVVNSGTLGYQFGLYWPRQVYARGLDELTKEGAKAVAFDVFFVERRSDQPGVALTNGDFMPSDEYFAEKLRNAGNIILAADSGTSTVPDSLFKTNAWRIGNIATDRDADGTLRRERAFTEYREWHWITLQFASQLDFDLTKTDVQPGKIVFHGKNRDETVRFDTDSQGMINTTDVVNPVPAGVPVKFAPFTNKRMWSMGILMAAYQLGLDLDNPEIDLPHHRIVLHGENGLIRVIPVDENGYFYVDWSLGVNDSKLARGAFQELLQAEKDRADGKSVTNQWKDKLVVVGSTASGNDLTDKGATPLDSFTYLVSKHWNVANSIITGRFITTTPKWLNLLLIIMIGALSAWITSVVARPVNASILMTAMFVLYIVAAVLLFVQWRVWLPIVLPMICAGIITHLSAVTYRVTAEQSEKKQIRSVFSRLVSPEVVNELLNAKGLSLEGEGKHITVLFADIRGFTELTDAAQVEGTEFVQRHELSAKLAEDYFKEQARQVMQTVSDYLSTIADCVKKQNGTLDKYIGDCVMAFWGAPLDNPHHALAAVRCAIEAQRALSALNAQRQVENQRRETENFERLRTGQPTLPRLPVLSMGTGINTGMAIAGVMGSKVHLVNYTVFGREVNLASRLEGLSGHGRIIIGEGTYAELQRDDPPLANTCVELPRQPVKGFRELVRIFEVPWRPPVPSPAPPQPGQSRDNTPAVA